jgi:predicted nucleic acid-binding protein
LSRILVDTPVWRRHFSGKLTQEQGRWFTSLLDDDGTLLIHPWIIGELVLGGISPREEDLLQHLTAASEVADADLLGFIRHRRLAQRGIGWVDAQLLACSLTHSALLWTIDKDLEAVAEELEIKFQGLD